MYKYGKLFEPLRLGKLELKNRLVVLPYGTAMVAGGRPLAGDLAHFENIAKSGPGLIISGAAVVHPSSAGRNQILIEAFDENIATDLKKKTDAIHKYGVPIFAQLVHLGREWPVADSDYPPMAPSAVRSPRDAYAPKEMNEKDIEEIIDSFGRSALNMLNSGFDGIEIHAAHGYLVAQFLSPSVNKRSDSYGGSDENRLRFLLEIIGSIRSYCGQDMPLSVRLSADEELYDGLEIADTVKIAKALERHGGVDLLSITIGTRGSYVKDMTSPQAAAVNACKAIKKQCNIPLIAGQRISHPELAEKIIEDKSADLIGMARAFIADPDWITKVRSGEPDRIRPCLNFNQDCRAFSPHLHCGVNPTAGRESTALFRQIKLSSHAKSIAIIGGGPGGLEAALMAAQRGHTVTVYEGSDSFGGQFLCAASVPNRSNLAKLLDYQMRELRRLKVRLLPNHQISSCNDFQEDHDAAIVATGAEPIPISEELSNQGALLWLDILRNGAPEPHGKAQAVYVEDGTGFWWNYGVAEALALVGWNVTYVTPSASIGHMIPHESVTPLLTRLGTSNVVFQPLTTLLGLDGSEVTLMNMTSGADFTYTCDMLVVHNGRRPIFGLADSLRKNGLSDVHVIGDCITPRRVSHAIFEAQSIARVI